MVSSKELQSSKYSITGGRRVLLLKMERPDFIFGLLFRSLWKPYLSMETVGWKIEGLRPIMVMYVKFSLLILVTDCTSDANYR